MRRLGGIAAYLGTLGVALACLGPVLRRPLTTVVGPFGGIDAVFQVGLLEWTARTWATPSAWMNPPIFWPVNGVLGMMDPLLGQAWLVAPCRLLGATPILSYNLAFLFSLLLAGAAMLSLWRASGGSRLAGGVAALALVGSPYTLAQIGHLNQLPPPFTVTALACCLAALRATSDGRRAWPWWWALGASLALQAAWGWYGFAYAVLGVTGILIWRLVRDRASLPFLRVTATAILPAALAVGAVFWLAQPQLELGDRYGDFTRTVGAVRAGSADIQDVLNRGVYRSGPADWFGHGAEGPARYAGRDRHVLNPGWVALALAALGWLRRGRLDEQQRRDGLLLLGLGVLGFVLAFGESVGLPFTDARAPLPLAWLRAVVPAFEAFRGAWRFSYLTVIAVAWWAAAGWSLGCDMLRGRGLRAVFALGAPLLLLLVSLPAAVPALRLPLDAVRIETADAGPVFTAPAPAVEYDEDVTEAAWWLRALQTGRPVTGGVSGWVPPETRALRARMARCEVGGADPAVLLREQVALGCTGFELALRPDDPRTEFWRDAFARCGAAPSAGAPAGYETWRLPAP